tara:strand:+ start:8744 stop:10009 length:1266 start_codon:yes stop_codon:yes gene_type:complete
MPYKHPENNLKSSANHEAEAACPAGDPSQDTGAQPVFYRHVRYKRWKHQRPHFGRPAENVIGSVYKTTVPIGLSMPDHGSDNSNKAIETVVLGLSCASASVTFSILDVLASVGRDWQMLHGHPARPPAFHPRLLSVDGEAYHDPNGRMIVPDGGLDDCPHPDLIIITDFHIDPTGPPPNDFGLYAQWVRSAHSHGATVASVCSGAILLAEAGLLDDTDATTHWGYFDTFRQRYPKVKLRRERILVPSGEGHRVITAGGASAWADLLLYLIGHFVDPEEARRIARVYLLQTHNDGQLHYGSLMAGRQHEDRLVADAQIWLADNYKSANPVATMAERSGRSERSFLRRFRRATGQSPVEYLQTLRIEEAKQMLEATDMPIDDIALEVGYAEGSSFRRLFRKQVGMTASAYRRQRVPAPGAYRN